MEERRQNSSQNLARLAMTRPRAGSSRAGSFMDFGHPDNNTTLSLSALDALDELPPNRPSYSRATTISMPPTDRDGTIGGDSISATLPRLTRKETKLAQKEAHPWQHLGLTLGGPAILLFDIVIPCIIYYTWYARQRGTWINQCESEFPGQHCPIPRPQFDKDILGSAVACFGFGELWIWLARVHRLWYHHDDCAPLLYKSKWALDATSWVYLLAMIVALIPFVVGSSLVIPELYLYGPSCLMGFLGILMVVSRVNPLNIPFPINSHAKGSRMRPFIYYAAEDFIAVDGLQDREFRVRYNERYESNKMFRRFFENLTLLWIVGVCVYIGAVSAVIWTLPFHIAFGLSLGVLFGYIATFAAITAVWVDYEMKREHRAYEEGRITA